MLKRAILLVMLFTGFTGIVYPANTSTGRAAAPLANTNTPPIQTDTLSDSPLLDMLALIPEAVVLSPNSPHPVNPLYPIDYVNLDAILTARPGAPHIANWAEFEAIRNADDDDPRFSLWMSALTSISSGPRDLLQYWFQFENLVTTVGFDIFTVEQAVAYGAPPSNVMLLAGDFDPDAITTAFAERDYTVEQTNPVTLLCGPDGCESGLDVNPQQRDPANPFGGTFGRLQPIIATGHYVMSSPEFAQLQAMITTINGDVTSLAEVPDYRAVVEAIHAQGTITQAMFLNADQRRFSPLAALGGRVTPENIAQLRERFGLDRPLAEQMEELVPVYNLAVFAHTVHGDQQTVFIALVYDAEEDARIAGERVVERINDYARPFDEKPMLDQLDQRGVTIGPPLIYSGQDTNKYVALVPLNSPLPSSEPDPETGDYARFGLTYRLLVTMYNNLDMFWLGTIESVADE